MKNKKRYILIVGLVGIVLLGAAILFAIKNGHHEELPSGRMENMHREDFADDDDIIFDDSTVFE
ncbi:MAG: hypothetical protein K2J95_13995 [Lachnospiraceae bacterium]|nr:hypothetical protein [Lachnospiraceae bacterium]MDE6744982.1 hypothetical protein [Lachnospiraceae bacterium]